MKDCAACQDKNYIISKLRKALIHMEETKKDLHFQIQDGILKRLNKKQTAAYHIQIANEVILEMEQQLDNLMLELNKCHGIAAKHENEVRQIKRVLRIHEKDIRKLLK